MIRIASNLTKLCANAQVVQQTTKNVYSPGKLFARHFRDDARIRWKEALKVKPLETTGAKANLIGKGAIAGAAVVGIGALGYYGIGQGNQATIQNNSMLWPDYVRDRIHTTYGYFGASIAFTALSSMVVLRSPRILNFYMRQGWMSMIGTFALMIGSGIATQLVPYTPGIGLKQLLWVTHCAIIGATIAPLCLLGGPVISRAACYTAGIVGGLSTVAVCAPSDKFLNMGGVLGIGLGVVVASSLASMFLAPTTALGAGAASLSLYGGLVLFSGFLLYDTQRIVRNAEDHPIHFADRYDPINASLSIYMDTLNIFIRIVSILAGGGQRRK